VYNVFGWPFVRFQSFNGGPWPSLQPAAPVRFIMKLVAQNFLYFYSILDSGRLGALLRVARLSISSIGFARVSSTQPRLTMGQSQGKGKDGKGEAPVIDLQNKSLDKFIQEARKSNALKVLFYLLLLARSPSLTLSSF